MIGKTQVFLNGDLLDNRQKETNLGSYVTGVMLAWVKANLPLIAEQCVPDQPPICCCWLAIGRLIMV